MKNEMTISRESLAMKLFVYGKFNPTQCFMLADEFIAYAEKHRDPPKVCVHRFGYKGPSGVYHCISCGHVPDTENQKVLTEQREPKACEPEPPKPERVAVTIGEHKHTGIRFCYDGKKSREYEIKHGLLPRGSQGGLKSCVLPIRVKCVDVEYGVYQFASPNLDVEEYGVSFFEVLE